ncbi:MAG: sterol desaturase family protein [Pseudooceanicola sp.]|nr:sterol desaturase family protein [Pseudooceanicola sp.]
MDTLIAFGQELMRTPLDAMERVSALYLACAVVIAAGVWLVSGREKSLIAFLFPREVYTHRSNLMDLKLFLVNKLTAFIGLTGAVFFPPLVAFAVLSMLAGWAGAPENPTTWGRGALATLVIVLASDFCKYWAHRWHHELRALWPFHAVHHSADVLTPLTVMRTHPVESLIRNLLITAIVGMVQGLVLFLLVGQIDILTLGGANAFYFVFNALGSNLRHSHVWLSYGRVLEHIFISPAQHQIHHSVAKQHHDCNYGSMFAIWDWMFGTLYIPERRETLRFGVSDAEGNPKPQPHLTLADALVTPFRESWQALRPALPRGEAAMSPGFSLWLDFLRAAAAVTVLFGHLAHTRFTRGDYAVLREVNIASDAVIVFFVLSGVVIAYAAGRDGSLARFAFMRATRVFSVVLPALVLTALFDALGTRADASAYPADYYQALPLWELFWRGLTFTNEWQGALSDRLRLGTNGPLWSLSYEVAFYGLFAVAVFLRGPLRIVLLALGALLVGWPILALLPAWSLGVGVWHLGRLGMPAERAWVFALGAPLTLVALKAMGLAANLSALTAAWVAPMSHHALLGYSDEVLWNSVIAVGVALHLVGVRSLVAGWQPAAALARAVRWVAGASFSLYVVHYPTLHLLDAVLPGSGPGRDALLLGGTLAVALAFAAVFERPLGRWRGLARGLLPQRQQAQVARV